MENLTRPTSAIHLFINIIINVLQARGYVTKSSPCNHTVMMVLPGLDFCPRCATR
jgi:hypothetical protein